MKIIDKKCSRRIGSSYTTGGCFFGAPTQTGFVQQATNQQGGTAIAKFQAPKKMDTLNKGSSQAFVNTKQQCITFMRTYSEKSVEELRIEDYAVNRTGPRGGGGMLGAQHISGVFGRSNQQQVDSLFGNRSTQSTKDFSATAKNTFGGGKRVINFLCIDL